MEINGSQHLMTSLTLSTTLAAQSKFFQRGTSIGGEVRLSDGSFADSLYAELYDTRSYSVVARSAVTDGRFHFPQVAPSQYTIRVVNAFGEQPLLEEPQQIGDVPASPITLVLPTGIRQRPPSGGVSVQDLRRPILRKAIDAAQDAQRFSQSGDTHKAIVKLEAAIRIAPAYREAHVNLGVEYARAGRIEDAIKEFHEALDIGPPAAPIYTNLAVALLAIGQFREARTAISKALALDSTNSAAARLLGYADAYETEARPAQK